MVQDPQLPRHASDPLSTVRGELRRFRRWVFTPGRPRLFAAGALAVILAGTLTGDAVSHGWHRKHAAVPAAATTTLLGPATGAPAPQPAAGRPIIPALVPIAWSGPGAERPGLPQPTQLPLPVTAPVVTALAANGIPLIALEAYKAAAARLAVVDPSCGLSWSLLAGIGRVESDHGQYAGAQLHANGTTTPHIIGIALNGHGTAYIPAPPNGLALDGDAVYAHALGPMQFIPSTWAEYRADGNGDGVDDVFNIFDATLGAARYLCASGGNLATVAGQRAAVFSYNHSGQYVAEVLALAAAYAQGISVVGIPGPPHSTVPPVRTHRHLPPVNPGPPLGVRGSGHHGGTGTGRPTRPAGPSSSASGPPSSQPPTTPSSSSTSASASPSSSSPSTTTTTPAGSCSTATTTGATGDAAATAAAASNGPPDSPRSPADQPADQAATSTTPTPTDSTTPSGCSTSSPSGTSPTSTGSSTATDGATGATGPTGGSSGS